MQYTLTAVEVAVLVGCSLQTLNYWYSFKRQNPSHKLAKKLPAYKQKGDRQTRYWREQDIKKLIEFKNNLPKGRNGLLGSVTQRYYHKEKGE